MRKLLTGFFALMPIAATAAPRYAESAQTTRAGMQTNRVGSGATNTRLTVPVTTTTTTNTHVPEVNDTQTAASTYEIDLNGQKAACLMTAGNVWANRLNASPDGVPATFPKTENPNAADNACFTLVSMQSSEIKNMGRFFPPRYFRQGDAVECGSWIDQQVLDDAILDSKKTGRIIGTIAASVGGAAIGVGITELIGRKFITGFEGQKDYERESKELLTSLKNDKRNPENAAAYKNYEAAIQELVKLCGDNYKSITGEHSEEAIENCETAERINNVMKSI